MKTNFAENPILKLQFGDSTATVRKEVKAYQFDTLVADFGGALGLFLGFSFYLFGIFMKNIFIMMKNNFLNES